MHEGEKCDSYSVHVSDLIFFRDAVHKKSLNEKVSAARLVASCSKLPQRSVAHLLSAIICFVIKISMILVDCASRDGFRFIKVSWDDIIIVYCMMGFCLLEPFFAGLSVPSDRRTTALARDWDPRI